MRLPFPSRPGLLLFSAIAGLGCGLLIRQATARQQAALPPPAAKPGFPARQAKPGRARDDWELLLSGYLADPPSSSEAAAPPLPQSVGAEADGLLRLVKLPVSGASIREGIAFLNATDAQRYGQALPAIFARWAAQDPDAAQEAANDLRDPGARVALMWEVFHHRGKTDAAEAISLADKLPTSILRSAALSAVTDALTPAQFPEVLSSLTKTGTPAQNAAHASFQRNIFLAWAKTDPAAPLRFATGIEDPAWRAAMIQTALRLPLEAGEAGEIDPAALLQLAGDPRNTSGITQQTAQLLTMDKADEILAAMPSEAARQAVLKTAVGSMLALISRDEGVPEEYKVQTSDNLNTLAQKYAAQGKTASFQQSLMEAATQGDPAIFTTAAAWMTEHDPARLDELTARAAAQIPFTAAKWLATLPPGPNRDQAVAVFAETHAAADPERATAWAGSITDTAKRAATLAAVGRQAAAKAPQ